MYTKKTLQHFNNPHNYGKIENPDGVGKVGNIVCGDVMWLYIKVEKNKIKDIKFETFGCVAALSTSSVITDLAKGKTLEEALKISKDEVINSLGGLPPVKIHCSVLAVDALTEAIYNYFSKNSKTIPESLEKQHRQLQKEEAMTKEKYKDWVETEEEIHKHGHTHEEEKEEI